MRVGCGVFEGNVGVGGELVNDKVIRCLGEVVDVVWGVFDLGDEVVDVDGKWV